MRCYVFLLWLEVDAGSYRLRSDMSDYEYDCFKGKPFGTKSEHRVYIKMHFPLKVSNNIIGQRTKYIFVGRKCGRRSARRYSYGGRILRREKRSGSLQ